MILKPVGGGLISTLLEVLSIKEGQHDSHGNIHIYLYCNGI